MTDEDKLAHWNSLEVPKIHKFIIGTFVLLLITFANSLDPDQALQNVGPDLNPICLTLSMKKFCKQQKSMKNSSGGKELLSCELLVSADNFCKQMRLDPDQASLRQNIGPDLEPICLTLSWY